DAHHVPRATRSALAASTPGCSPKAVRSCAVSAFVDEDGAYGVARAGLCAGAASVARRRDPRLARLAPRIAVGRILGDAARRSGGAGDLRRSEGLRLRVGGVLDEPGVDRLRQIGVPGGLLEPRGAQQ